MLNSRMIPRIFIYFMGMTVLPAGPMFLFLTSLTYSLMKRNRAQRGGFPKMGMGCGQNQGLREQKGTKVSATPSFCSLIPVLSYLKMVSFHIQIRCKLRGQTGWALSSGQRVGSQRRSTLCRLRPREPWQLLPAMAEARDHRSRQPPRLCTLHGREQNSTF